MKEQLRLEVGDPYGHRLDLGGQRSRPCHTEVVREREHPLGEPVVLAKQVALTMLQMRELGRQRLGIWELLDRHDCSYRQRRAGT